MPKDLNSDFTLRLARDACSRRFNREVIMEKPSRIASFSVNHDFIDEGIYVSRIDGDIITYDLRTRKPNSGDYMDNLTMHSVEHMIATYIRNGKIGSDVIYFGPMGCQTGFYLLVRNRTNEEVLHALRTALTATVNNTEGMFGARREECGNYQNLDILAAKRECERFLNVISKQGIDFKYKEQK